MMGVTLKAAVIETLKSEEFERQLNSFAHISPHRLIAVLQSALCTTDECIRWHAVTALGIVVASRAMADIEAGRRVIRRLMWTITEESGGIGWGAPEAIAEILARHDGLAREYAQLLVSYLVPDGNYLEFEPLREGILWGIARLAEAQPRTMVELDVVPYLRSYVTNSNPVMRGLAVWALGDLRAHDAVADIEKLQDDRSPIRVYREERFVSTRVADLAVEALLRLTEPRDRWQGRLVEQ